MKKYIVFLIFCNLITITSFCQNKKYQKESVKVWGNCGMCKSLIENAAESVDGVKYAIWDSKKNVMKVKFVANETNINEIQKAVSKIGYDTESYRANDEVYNNLHHCCKYERKQMIKNSLNRFDLFCDIVKMNVKC